jgi:hypothetical protein
MTMVQNHYEMTISKNNRHVFSTSSAITLAEAKALYVLLEWRFPRQEGYTLTVAKIDCSGSYFSREELLQLPPK